MGSAATADLPGSAAGEAFSAAAGGTAVRRRPGGATRRPEPSTGRVVRTPLPTSTLAQLAARLESVYHSHWRAALPRITSLYRSAGSGGASPGLARSQQVYLDTVAGIERHIRVEESVLYPVCHDTTRAGQGSDGALDDVLRDLSVQHTEVEAALRIILRELPSLLEVPALQELLHELGGLAYSWRDHALQQDRLLFPTLRRALGLVVPGRLGLWLQPD